MEESAVIISCPRTEGDGMECSDDRIAPSHSDFEVAAAADGLASLDVSPSKSLDRVITLIPQITRSAVASTHAKKSPGASQSEKKLKFVPYEPYKAAVKPIIPYKKKEKKPVVPVHTEFRDSPPHPVAASGTIGGNDKELEKIRKEKEELESQLKIHSRVNEELKRLLVASLGEDMEARVHFLTEDKIKLGDDIRLYVEQIAVDYEKKEKLSIEADIWRSKFLASSVVVEDLTKWKSALLNRNDQLQICLQNLFDETERIHHNHQQTLHHMKALSNAFDPLASPGGSRLCETTSVDVMGTSKSILNLAVSLCKRLLGAYNQVQRHQQPVDDEKPQDNLSPAQRDAQKVLSRHPMGSCTMSEMMREVSAQRVSTLAHRSLNKSFYACCNQCTGDIQTI